jgi:CRISPR-associated protein Csb2
MRLVLTQSFPLGRFHAIPWRVNPFDDSFGEWPPSPWRFVRAVVARWYQWRRELNGEWDEAEVESLVIAMCSSDYRFHLPANAWRGTAVRQYHPVKLEMDPPNFKAFEAAFTMPANGLSDTIRKRLEDANAEVEIADLVIVRVTKYNQRKKIEQILGVPYTAWNGLNPDPGLRRYSTTLTQDNYWCMPPGEAGDILWFIESEEWTPDLAGVLEQCVDRISYFGRAESLTQFRRIDDAQLAPNCELLAEPVSGAVPVLTPRPDATRADVERVTEDPLAARNIPQGARIMYARRPQRPPLRERPRRRPTQPDSNLMQLALGWAVAPEPRAVVRLTARFRSAVIRELIRIKSDGRVTTWSAASAELRNEIAEMIGKDAQGRPLQGPRRHAEFFAWGKGSAPTRLLVWRQIRPFDEQEQSAILEAAMREISWAAAGRDADAWKLRLVPLDAAVSPPPGFDGEPCRTWISLTPYVPPRHHLRGGKVREPETIENQVRRELGLREVSGAQNVEIERVRSPEWVAVHVPRREAAERTFIGHRRGYWLRLYFPEPVSGPIRVGHSSSFGLGLFVPQRSTHTDRPSSCI